MLTKNKQAILTVLCGLLSGGAFATTLTAGNGLLILFLPVIPLAVVGFSVSARHGLVASLLACVAVGALLDRDYVPLFFLVCAFPSYHFIRKALLWRGDEHAREWFSVLTILAEITAYTAALFMVLALLSVAPHSDHSNLKDLIAQSLSSELENPDPRVAELMKTVVTDWSFLIFAGLGWMWVSLLYLCIAATNIFLTRISVSLRPSLRLPREGLPHWLPVILLISAGLVFIGNDNDRFAGETLFLLLLLPYFLSGIATIHHWALERKNREFWLTFFYLLLTLFFPWIAMLLIAAGIKTQAESFFKEKPENL